MGVRELAKAAGVSPTTITRLERGEDLHPRTLEAIRRALEHAGVKFIPENGGGSGVRLRKPTEQGAAPASDPAPEPNSEPGQGPPPG
jgi:transcriptional regulator with XRE-family HTH domain